jgi:predicted small lipoprotein YifL
LKKDGKKMKKMLVFMSFALLLSLSFFSCGKKKNEFPIKSVRAPKTTSTSGTPATGTPATGTDGARANFIQSAQQLANSITNLILSTKNNSILHNTTLTYVGIGSHDSSGNQLFFILKNGNANFRSEYFSYDSMGNPKSPLAFAHYSTDNNIIFYAIPTNDASALNVWVWKNDYYLVGSIPNGESRTLLWINSNKFVLQ